MHGHCSPPERDLLLRFFLNAINRNYKNTDFVVYFASYLWRRYSETRGLHTATLVATSSSSLNQSLFEPR